MALVLNEDWTVYVVGEMHRYRITNLELAEESGYDHTYLSTVLNGNKDFSTQEGANRAKERIIAALERIKARRMKEVENAGTDAGSEGD